MGSSTVVQTNQAACAGIATARAAAASQRATWPRRRCDGSRMRAEFAVLGDSIAVRRAWQLDIIIPPSRLRVEDGRLQLLQPPRELGRIALRPRPGLPSGDRGRLLALVLGDPRI